MSVNLAREVSGIDLPEIPAEYLGDYDIQKKLAASTNHFAIRGIMISSAIDRIIFNNRIKRIEDYLESKPELSTAVFAITRFTDINNWEAIRVYKYSANQNVYKKVLVDAVGCASIIMKNGKCTIYYFPAAQSA